MRAAMFAFEVKRPVVLEVAIGPDGTQPEHSFRSAQGPAGTRAVHAVFDEISARALDDAGADGQAVAQGSVVVQELAVVDQIPRAVVNALAVVSAQAPLLGAAPHALGHRA